MLDLTLNNLSKLLSFLLTFFFMNKQQYIKNKRHIKEAPQSTHEVYKGD